LKNLYKELGVESILLIEDDPWSRDSLTTFFQIVECRMESAGSAMEAIAAVSRNRFDLILCEYQLPGMNGLILLGMLGIIFPGPSNSSSRRIRSGNWSMKPFGPEFTK
jgi:DNA-binding LytR/AlgR family response regulator